MTFMPCITLFVVADGAVIVEVIILCLINKECIFMIYNYITGNLNRFKC